MWPVARPDLAVASTARRGGLGERGGVITAPAPADAARRATENHRRHLAAHAARTEAGS